MKFAGIATLFAMLCLAGCSGDSSMKSEDSIESTMKGSVKNEGESPSKRAGAIKAEDTPAAGANAPTGAGAANN